MSVEERLAILAGDVAELKLGKPPAASKANWLDQITGSFKDDPDFGEILRLGREIRNAENIEDGAGEL